MPLPQYGALAWRPSQGTKLYCLVNRDTLGVNNLPRVAARIMPRPESNPRPLDHESNTLPLHYRAEKYRNSIHHLASNLLPHCVRAVHARLEYLRKSEWKNERIMIPWNRPDWSHKQNRRHWGPGVHERWSVRRGSSYLSSVRTVSGTDSGPGLVRNCRSNCCERSANSRRGPTEAARTPRPIVKFSFLFFFHHFMLSKSCLIVTAVNR